MKRVVLDNTTFLQEVINLVSNGAEVELKVKGYSMLPFIIGDRDSVVLSKIEGPLKRGDIVLGKFRGNYILHRVIKIGKEQVLLMGDGNIKVVEECKIEDIYAKAVAIIKSNKRRVNPYSKLNLFYSKVWFLLLPIRRYIMFIYRRTILKLVK